MNIIRLALVISIQPGTIFRSFATFSQGPHYILYSFHGYYSISILLLRNMYILYGIKNCDTVKKARQWLLKNRIDYQFHDFRIDGLDIALLEQLESAIGWKNMLNQRSTSWRQLSDSEKSSLSRDKAITLMLETPTLIKRPVIDTGKKMLIGFKPQDYQTELP